MVHIKKVEIFGFKSFGFKNTIVDFQPGLVSISGPNGSGKSNILDAIIFAMGENKPKTMRADKLRSLIHDIEGAARRGPKLARSSVHFENVDRKIPVDSDNVEVTREMDANGESTYYLNKKKTKRNQILDMLDVANAGLNQLNAVQQGTITRISEFSPEEKRKTIEDLIGLTAFDEKKNAAEAQLQAADQKLAISLARMDEVKKQIDVLEVERNLKFRLEFIQKELRRLQAILAAGKLKSLKVTKQEKEQTLNALSSEIEKLSNERYVIKEQIAELSKQKSNLMEKADAFNQEKASLESKLSSFMQKHEEANSGMVAINKRIHQINSRQPEIQNEIEQIYQQQTLLDTKFSQIKESLEQTNLKKQNISNQLKDIDTLRDKILKEQSKIAAKKNEIDQKLKTLNEKINSAKLSLRQSESNKSNIESKISSNNNLNLILETESEKLTGLKKRLESMSKNHQATINEINNKLSELGSKRNKIEKEIEEWSLILEKSAKAAAQYGTKIHTVKGIMHEDYSVARLKENAAKLGIEGLVYEMISWGKKFDRAILAVGSDWIKAIVVKDFATLVSIAEEARAKKLPRFKIIPLDAIPNFKLDLPKNSGALGVLSDYVKCDKKYSALKTFLFGNVVLANSRDSAHKISKCGYKTVTIDGEFFESKTNGVVIDIDSKISKLTKLISMGNTVEGLIQMNYVVKNRIQKLKQSLKKTEESVNVNKDRLVISKTSLADANNKYKDLDYKILNTQKRRQDLVSRNYELEQKKEQVDNEISKQESYLFSLEQHLEMVDDNYASGEQQRISNELDRINVKKSLHERERTEIMTEFSEKNSQLGELKADESRAKSNIRNLQDENSDLEQEKQNLIQKSQELEKVKEEANIELVKLRDKEQELISTSGGSVTQLKEFDEKLTVLNDNEKELTKKINTFERQTDSLSRDLKEIIEEVSVHTKTLAAFGYDENIETFDVEDLTKALVAEERTLTEINATAPARYMEISDGYRSMSSRKNSLEGERNSIVRFIEEIERDKKQTFLNGFDKVDQEIRTIFSKMTGGNAWLELQNEDDIFSSGISYIIQFKNKPKRESTGISGGEKTLAAVVFVLALQKLNPSPFYLFDEVDAHLDAPNSEKLSKILAERSQESQFIMVSLKDSVVEKAKLIYGVFPKNGVSHVVTYKDKRLPSITT